MHLQKSLLFAATALTLIGAPLAIGPSYPGLLGIASVNAATSVTVDVFFSTLQPYGRWVSNPDYNYVWVPTRVDRDWAPYTHGHWIYTERYGWYFASDEPFAAIVYHYGRWGYDQDIGWFWVPGTKWAPAWVAWRRGDRDVGWAPLPPERHGFAVDLNITINIGDIPQDRWYFVPAPQFLAPNLWSVAVSGDRNQGVYRRSRPEGPMVVQNNIVVNNVINLNFIEQQTKQKVDVHQIKEVTDPKQATGKADAKGSVSAYVAAIQIPSGNEKPKDAIDQQEIAKQPPPTSGSKQETASGGNGATGQLTNAQNQQPPCVDTDPKKKGCQPAAESTAGPSPDNGQTQGNAASNQPATGMDTSRGNAQPSNAPNGQAPCVDTDPKRKGCQPGTTAGNPNPGKNSSSSNASQTKLDTGNSNNGAANVGATKGGSHPTGADQTGGINRQPKINCPNDADPNKPGCQQQSHGAGQSGQQGDIGKGAGPAAQDAGRNKGQGPQQSSVDHKKGSQSAQAGQQGDQANCAVDADPKKPGCQPPKQQ